MNSLSARWRSYYTHQFRLPSAASTPARRSAVARRRPELDRLGRNLRHLIALLDDLQALGVAFVSLAEGDRRDDTCRQS
ncbi:MAG: recombinase family protein [Vicinamibacterales bacterium]